MKDEVPSATFEGLSILVDELGEAARINVDLGFFDKSALFKAAYWTTEKAFLHIFSGENDTQVVVEFRPKVIKDGNVEMLAREFCNALIDQQTRQIVLAETSEVRDALLRKAFGEGHRHLDPEKL